MVMRLYRKGGWGFRGLRFTCFSSIFGECEIREGRLNVLHHSSSKRISYLCFRRNNRLTQKKSRFPQHQRSPTHLSLKTGSTETDSCLAIRTPSLAYLRLRLRILLLRAFPLISPFFSLGQVAMSPSASSCKKKACLALYI